MLASQNPSKILPKRLRNRCPNKQRFLFQNASTAKVPTRVLYWFFPHETVVGHFSSNRFSHAFWVQKTHQKPFQNHVRTFPKSMPKTCCFFLTTLVVMVLFLIGGWCARACVCVCVRLRVCPQCSLRYIFLRKFLKSWLQNRPATAAEKNCPRRLPPKGKYVLRRFSANATEVHKLSEQRELYSERLSRPAENFVRQDVNSKNFKNFQKISKISKKKYPPPHKISKK